MVASARMERILMHLLMGHSNPVMSVKIIFEKRLQDCESRHTTSLGNYQTILLSPPGPHICVVGDMAGFTEWLNQMNLPSG